MPLRVNEISPRALQLSGKLAKLRKRLRAQGVLPGHIRDHGPLALQLRTILEQMGNGNFDFADLGTHKLENLCNILDEIAAYDKRIWRGFVGRLRTHRFDDYFGVLCEIYVALVLMRQGTAFTQPDPPDFQIGSAKPANIECCSTHMDSESEEELTYKISSAINRKAKKPYSNEATALVVDITNIMYQSHKAKWNMTPDQLRKDLEKIAADSGFGAVLLQCQIGSIEVGRTRIEIVFERLDGRSLTAELKALLEQCFPRGEFRMEKFVFPRVN